MASVVNRSKKPSAPLPPPRVRKEPPTLEEAVFAAQGLTDDFEQQVAFAAGLMDVSEDEVRPLMAELPKPVRLATESVQQIQTARGATRVVVVERKGRFSDQVASRRIALARPGH